MEGKGQPTWQPISALGLIASIIDAQVQDGRDQHKLLSKARPYVLDDATVERLLRVYGETAEDLWLYDEQLARWEAQAISSAQRREVQRLKSQMADLRDVVEQILALGARLKGETIEVLLAKSDIEIGIEGLLGRRER
ncbi:MAG: hypothetical protein ACR2KK_05030 [Acidimicrobiales bacterium]